MRELIFIEDNSGNVTVPCPVGKRVRIVAMVFIVAGLADGDQLVTQFVTDGTARAVAASLNLTASVNAVGAAIGNEHTPARLAVTDPVTGVATYDQQMDFATMPLPDIWWPIEIRTQSTCEAGGTINRTIVTYEREDT